MLELLGYQVSQSHDGVGVDGGLVVPHEQGMLTFAVYAGPPAMLIQVTGKTCNSVGYGEQINAPVTVMKTAGEGGAWGIAILANYVVTKESGESLQDYLNNKVFAGQEGITLAPDPADVAGFEEVAKRYVKGLPIVREAVKDM